MTRQEIITRLEANVQRVVNGSASQYFSFEDEKENTWTIRVSDHTANPQRCDEFTISLVVQSDDEKVFFGQQKQFRNIANVHYLDSDGDLFENFQTFEELIEWYLD